MGQEAFSLPAVSTHVSLKTITANVQAGRAALTWVEAGVQIAAGGHSAGHLDGVAGTRPGKARCCLSDGSCLLLQLGCRTHTPALSTSAGSAPAAR